MTHKMWSYTCVCVLFKKLFCKNVGRSSIFSLNKYENALKRKITKKSLIILFSKWRKEYSAVEQHASYIPELLWVVRKRAKYGRRWKRLKDGWELGGLSIFGVWRESLAKKSRVVSEQRALILSTSFPVTGNGKKTASNEETERKVWLMQRSPLGRYTFMACVRE